MQLPNQIPSPRTTPPAAKTLLGCAGLLLLACIGVVVLGKAFDGGGGPHDWTAITAAREAVKVRLVSPGSVKFPSELSRIAARSVDGKYLVVYIAADSQNRLGALLRSESLVLLQDREDRMDVLHTLTFEKSPGPHDVRKLTEEVGQNWQIEPWVEDH